MTAGWQYLILQLSQEFEFDPTIAIDKVEVTAKYLLVLLDMLWSRAEDIPCNPKARIDLHATLIPAGFGFKPLL